MGRLNFPTDPLRWDRLHVSHWLHWVQSQFPDSPVDRNDWDMNGQELCSITLEEFKKKCPEDPGDTLWTHLELLKKCKFTSKDKQRQTKTDKDRQRQGRTLYLRSNWMIR